jgi:hypothetical protein
MRRPSTEELFFLGMALSADHKTMGRRVRGVFARKRSAKPAAALALVLGLALGIGCFTTACRPAGQAQAAPQPSSIPPETEQEASEAAAEPAFVQNAERESASFLTGFTESNGEPAPYPARIERDAVAIDDYKTLAFDADVIVPESYECSIAHLERHVFSDEEYEQFMDYLEPGADWRVNEPDGEPFSLEDETF